MRATWHGSLVNMIAVVVVGGGEGPTQDLTQAWHRLCRGVTPSAA